MMGMYMHDVYVLRIHMCVCVCDSIPDLGLAIMKLSRSLILYFVFIGAARKREHDEQGAPEAKKPKYIWQRPKWIVVIFWWCVYCSWDVVCLRSVYHISEIFRLYYCTFSMYVMCSFMYTSPMLVWLPTVEVFLATFIFIWTLSQQPQKSHKWKEDNRSSWRILVWMENWSTNSILLLLQDIIIYYDVSIVQLSSYVCMHQLYTAGYISSKYVPKAFSGLTKQLYKVSWFLL